jgi:hemin uptake protein HemP
LTQQFPSAVEGDGVVVRHDGTLYRLAVTQSV